MTPHALLPHRCEVFAYAGGTRFGFECLHMDCDAGAVGLRHLSDAECCAHNHEATNWERP